MKIKLKKLELTNFKGIDHFTFEPEGKSVEARGENGVGKTTLFDAWTYICWDEDSQGQSNAQFLPLNENGDEVEHIEATVKGTITVDDEELTLKKVLKQKWKEPRGQDTEIMEGHTVDYYWNGTPVQKSEYEERLEDTLGDLDRLRLLTDITAFNRLHWKDRREMLMDMVEGIDRQKIIDNNPELSQLNFDNKSVEDRRKQLRSEMSEIDDRLDEIPTRIDELLRDQPNIDEDKEELEEKAEEWKRKKKRLEEEIADLKSSGNEAQLREQRSNLKADLNEIEREWKDDVREELDKMKDKKRNLKSDLESLKSEIMAKKTSLDNKQETADELKEKTDDLREEYKEVADREISVDGECPTCGQELPEDQLEEKRKDLNEQKSEKLAEINEKGKKKRERLGKIQDEIKDLTDHIANLEQAKPELEAQLEEIENEITEKQEQLDKYVELEKYKSKQSELSEVEDRLESGENEPEGLEKLQNELSEVENRLEGVNKQITEVEGYERTQARVDELKSKESALAEEYETLKQQEQLLERFVEIKVNMLEENINEKFDLVDFKLFRPYKSKSGFKQTCETLIDGVSADSTLNRSGKMLAGLDIVSTLQEHYGTEITVWADETESITGIPEIEAQLISLRVSEGVEKLEVRK